MSFPSDSKCYIDQSNPSSNNCQDCDRPICGAHSLVQNRYVDRYTTGASFMVCPNCYEIYKKKTKVRTPLMIVFAILFIIITMFLLSSRFGGFFPGFP
jgi:hypothetical protein